MARLMCVAVILACFFSARSALAAGGSCPPEANYTSLTNPTGPLVTLASYGITSCYFVAANGADTNNGTSESTPWLHAPMMPSCSSSCATVQNKSGGVPAGTGIIFRGGDTWHFGNSSLTASGCSAGYEGGTWLWNTGQVPEGTSSHPIYLGVDQSWNCSGSWSRPVLTGDNPLCNASSVGTGGCTQYSGTGLNQMYYVTSCPYQNGSSNNRLIDLDWVSYYITDNFELTGLCEKSTGQNSHYDDYIDIGSLQGPQWFLNDYIHGWSHLSWADHNGGSNCTGSTVCINIFAFNGGRSSPPGETFLQVVIDGSDSDPGGSGFCFSGAYETAYSVILGTSQCIATDFHLFHDNVYADFYENGHSNMLESTNQSETPGTNAFYNNLLYNLETSGNQSGGYGIALSPPVGTTDYIFNNVWWNVGPLQNAISVSSSNYANVGALVVFNNTFQLQSGLMSNIFSCTPGSYTGSNTFANNHFITDYATVYTTTNCTGSKLPVSVSNLQMTNLTANANSSPKYNQYNALQAYAYAPVATTNSTVGVGTNEQSFCSALSTAASSDSTLSDAASACQNDTPYRCSYFTSTHSVSCQAPTIVPRPAGTAWDIGAYQLPASAPNRPTNLTGAVQ